MKKSQHHSPRPGRGEGPGVRGESNHRDPSRIAFARAQRRQANDFAKGVWEMLRGRRMLGEKFRREYPFGPYMLDFVCLDLKLNIEVDGKHHLTVDGQKHDDERDTYLRTHGFHVLRLPGFAVTQDPSEVRQKNEDVVRRLRAGQATEIPSPPTPLPESGRGESNQEWCNQEPEM